MVKATQPQSQRKSVAHLVSADGKVRKTGAQTQPEQVEMALYLSKLKDLVPNMPRHRKVSKVEVIEHVIDYICDLQTALENHPAGRNSHGAAAIVSAMLINNNNCIEDCSDLNGVGRQPLGVISAANATTTCAQEVSPTHEKSSTADCTSRTVSC